MTALEQAKAEINGPFVVTLDGKPVFVTADQAHLAEWLGETRGDIHNVLAHKVFVVSSEDFGSADVTEDLAALLARDWFNYAGTDETDWTDFPPFARAYADDTIQELIDARAEAGRAYAEARADYRAAAL